ncbi:hypothetical protein FRC03_005153 [Tulasnella sp. 419]|nr:hypothetical protein FRC03_005153 [Tulasnella sp. 419]
MEEIRIQLASQENASTMERKIQEISEKVDRLVATKDGIRPLNVPPSSTSATMLQDIEGEASVEENIAWEPCSPVTSVVSIVAPPSDEISEPSTPLAQPVSIPESSEAHPDGIANELLSEEGEGQNGLLLRVPSTWRRPIATLTRKAQITRAQRVSISYSGHGHNE